MERCNSFKRSLIIEALPIVANTQRGGTHVSLANVGVPCSPKIPNQLQSQNLKISGDPESGRNIYARRRSIPLCVAVTNTEPRPSKVTTGLGTPLKPSSPEGKFLSAILQNEHHLFEFAVSEQLDELVSDRDGAAARKKESSGSMESFLHRRIAEMRENECQNAVEDVMYMSIVHKFSEVRIPMVPRLSECINNNHLEIWPSKCRELESIHSLEFQEMIREHVATILRMRGKSSATDEVTTTKIDTLHLGRIYAASIMYGYFLKSACFRRQLDLSVTRTQEALQPIGRGTYHSNAELNPCGFGSPMTLSQSTNTLVASLCQESVTWDTRHEKLSSYVKGFDSESLQRCAKLKSQAAVNVIEKHTWALFADEKMGELDSENDIVITFPSLERLALEAVAFGSFLWDVERSVDSVYGLKEN